jgi:probable addiction module antidote protein
MPKARAFDASKYRDNPKAIAKYLNDNLATGDPVLITKALGTMIRAQGMTRFAKKSGSRRDSLYVMFRGKSSPAFDTVLNVLRALDIQLIAKPSAALKSSD